MCRTYLSKQENWIGVDACESEVEIYLEVNAAIDPSSYLAALVWIGLDWIISERGCACVFRSTHECPSSATKLISTAGENEKRATWLMQIDSYQV